MTDFTNGNQYFSQIVNQAEQIPLLNAAKAIVPTINTQLVSSGFIWATNDPSLTSKKLYSIVGNSPNTFSTLASGVAQFLNINPNQPSSIENDGTVLVLPPGAKIVGAYAIDNGYVGGLLDIGMVQITGSIPTPHLDDFFGGLTQATVNAGGIVAAIPEITATSALGDQGDQPMFTPTVPSTGVTGVTVTSGSNVTASSGLTVTIYYVL
jgi:hypothetical protein